MKKTGTVEFLNVSPKGSHEGFLLNTGKRIVQVNFPKHEREAMGNSLSPGEEVSVEVEAEEPHGTPAHPVFRLIRVIGAAARQPEVQFSGKVKCLNYALHGEVNGGILGTGDFLHLKPEGARAVGLAVGMKVTGRGSTKPMVGGRIVIQAEEVNGISIRPGKAKKKHGPKHAKGH